MEMPADYNHLMYYAQERFAGSAIRIAYTEDEIIHIEVDGHRYTFEIGSDDDSYRFFDGVTSFTIPLFIDPTQD